MLKKSLRQRLSAHEMASIFQTGTFKKTIRTPYSAASAPASPSPSPPTYPFPLPIHGVAFHLHAAFSCHFHAIPSPPPSTASPVTFSFPFPFQGEDLQAINTFWVAHERELLARSKMVAELPYLRQQHEEQVQACLKWLTLNYLAVLKIAKKHDKHCGTQLHSAMAKVLMMQPFVIGMRASPLFFPDGAGAASCVRPNLESRSSEEDAAISLVISQLLGCASAHYFPQRLQEHIASLEDSCGSLSEPEWDPDLPHIDLDHPPSVCQQSSPLQGEIRPYPELPGSPRYEHGKPLAASPAADDAGWMMCAYLLLVGCAARQALVRAQAALSPSAYRRLTAIHATPVPRPQAGVVRVVQQQSKVIGHLHLPRPYELQSPNRGRIRGARDWSDLHYWRAMRDALCTETED